MNGDRDSRDDPESGSVPTTHDGSARSRRGYVNRRWGLVVALGFIVFGIIRLFWSS